MFIAGRPRAVPVIVGRGVASEPPVGMPRWESGLMIADRRVRESRGDVLDALISTLVDVVAPSLDLEAGEETKDAGNLTALWGELDRRHLDRGAVLFVVGGGSILDVGAFLAATWLRGVDLVVVPTTLLAQVDAGLGGKCGVNLGHAKNQVGAIWQPRAILADVDLLATLPPDEVASGMGEAVKTALLAGTELVDRVRALDSSSVPGDPGLEDVVRACLRYKAGVVEDDERDSGRLALAEGSPIPHGVAVAVGIRAETAALCQDAATRQATSSLLDAAKLPSRVALAFEEGRVRSLLGRDKKRRGERITVPVLNAVGDARLTAVDPDALVDACRSVLA
jgi:3-dehydroquinate synthase